MLFYEMMLYDDAGKLTATVTVLRNPRSDNVTDHVFGSAACRAVMNVFRAIPPGLAYVSAFYPDLNRRVIINHPPLGAPMDLSNIYSEREDDKTSALPTRLVAPAMHVVPADSLISFAQVETIADVLAAEPRSVLLFSESALELLAVVVDHPVLFGFNTMVLTGLPTAEYSNQFESKTYSLERLAYATFTNELVEATRVAAALKEEGKTPYEREREQFTRADGSVKAFAKHSLAGAPDKVEVDDAEA